MGCAVTFHTSYAQDIFIFYEGLWNASIVRSSMVLGFARKPAMRTGILLCPDHDHTLAYKHQHTNAVPAVWPT